MSETSHPAHRWLSSKSTKINPNYSMKQAIPLVISRRKLSQSTKYHQQSFAQRMATTKHYTEELFQLYNSNNIQCDTLQGEMITGTNVPSLHMSLKFQNHSKPSSRHCVSRERMNSFDSNCNKHHATVNCGSKQLRMKRTVQVRIDNKPLITSSSPSSSASLPSRSANVATTLTSKLNPSTDSPLTQQSESNKLPSINIFEHVSTASLKHDTNESVNHECSTSSTNLHPISSSILSLMNYQKQRINSSHSSFLPVSSTQKQHQPNAVTGVPLVPCQRSLTERKLSARSRVTIPTDATHLPCLKTSSSSNESNTSQCPMFIGSQRIVSIPSKCSRYVLMTFPPAPARYNSPTYVERLLLPERFPTLFQNIVNSYKHCHHNKR